MAKQNPYIDGFLKMRPARVFDQDALTAVEIGNLWGLSPAQANRYLRESIESGTTEIVAKRVDGRTLRAYRVKKKK